MFYWLSHPLHFNGIYILYITDWSVGGWYLASVAHRSLFLKLLIGFDCSEGEWGFNGKEGSNFKMIALTNHRWISE